LQVYWRKLWYPLVTYYYGKTLWLARDSQLYFITCIIMSIIICIMMYIIMYTYTYIKIYICISSYICNMYMMYMFVFEHKSMNDIIRVKGSSWYRQFSLSHAQPLLTAAMLFLVWRRLICKVMRRRARYMCWTPEAHASL
jgi:uncharacterized membrane-anchored protein